MADLLASQVSLTPGATSLSESEFFTARARTLMVRRLKLTSVSVGGATNRILASACGFSKFVHCGSFYDSTNNKIIPAAVDPINNIILIGVTAGTYAIGDLSSVTGYITVYGY